MDNGRGLTEVRLVENLSISSGCSVPRPLERLVAFFTEEYAYYDALVDADPNAVGVIDILAPVMMNAFSFGMGASKLRAIHRELAARCNPLLAAITPSAELAADDAPLLELRQLFDAAISVRGVLIPVATKVLHRKRRSLIPMLDNVVLAYYLEALDEQRLQARTQDHRAGEVAIVVTEAFRRDLQGASEPLDELCRAVGERGYDVTPVRVLEVLVWSQVEPVGYYRGDAPTTRAAGT